MKSERPLMRNVLATRSIYLRPYRATNQINVKTLSFFTIFIECQTIQIGRIWLKRNMNIITMITQLEIEMAIHEK